MADVHVNDPPVNVLSCSICGGPGRLRVLFDDAGDVCRQERIPCEQCKANPPIVHLSLHG